MINPWLQLPKAPPFALPDEFITLVIPERNAGVYA